MKKTITANDEKYFGLLHVSDVLLSMSQIPNSGGYKPTVVPRQIVHELSDGGIRIHNIRQKFKIDISLKYVNETLRNSLKTVYDRHDEFVFCPFGTTTAWDGIFFESVWVGDFKFYEYADDAAASGFDGNITLRETPA
jgi:hypothetical protein